MRINWSKCFWPAVGIAISAIVLFVIYATYAGNGNGATAGQKYQSLDKFRAGDVAAFVINDPHTDWSMVSFKGADGAEKTLSDYAGRILLVNVWATWCAPCREEMPALNELQKKMKNSAFDIIALNVDRGDDAKGKRFFADLNIDQLTFGFDSEGRIMRTIRAIGLPVTLLIDRNGIEIGRLTGPADWASADAIALIEAALALN